jgi:hypothetical protein
MRGAKGSLVASWDTDKDNYKDLIAAAAVRELDEESGAVDFLNVEAMRADSPRTRQPNGSSDYLFVWGARPDIYYWSGLLPASRYLTSQLLTGVPADVHYKGDNYKVVLEESISIAARAQLLADLEQTQPKYIIDDLGMYNAELAIDRYTDLGAFMHNYKRIKSEMRFIIYIRTDELKERPGKKRK